jgi:hypothetical protein
LHCFLELILQHDEAARSEKLLEFLSQRPQGCGVVWLAIQTHAKEKIVQDLVLTESGKLKGEQ